MSSSHSCASSSTLFAMCVAAVLCTGCQTLPPAKPMVAAPEHTEPPAAQPEPPAEEAAVPAVVPAGPPSKEDKARAQRLALDAMEKLQNGDEDPAREALEQTLKLDPENELARKLSDQMNADAQQELGSVFFKYAVQHDDTLAKLAQRFLNDRFRFYILAKYNDLRVPNRLAAGQVIKIPGHEPKPVAVKHAEIKPTEQVKLQETVMVPAPPKPAEPDTARQASIQRFSREAEACQRRQNLDCAVQKWNEVLQLDPGNEQAKLKREKAMSLNEQLKKFK